MATVALSVGEEFKKTTMDDLVELAADALALQRKMRSFSITNEEDVLAFMMDLDRIRWTLDTIDANTRKAKRWYAEGGS